MRNWYPYPQTVYPDIQSKYIAGETLRNGAMALYRQAVKRSPGLKRPPRSVFYTAFDAYDKWHDQDVLRYYDGFVTDDLTAAELRASDRFIQGWSSAQSALSEHYKRAENDLLERLEIDPYEHLTWTVGTEDDFICFDYGIDEDAEKVVFLAVVNSETGSFIQNFGDLEWCEPANAVRMAIGMVDRAMQWCDENTIEDDKPGGNWGGHRFVEDVRKNVAKAFPDADTSTPNPFPSKDNPVPGLPKMSRVMAILTTDGIPFKLEDDRLTVPADYFDIAAASIDAEVVEVSDYIVSDDDDEFDGSPEPPEFPHGEFPTGREYMSTWEPE